jgi:carboxylesterase
MDAFTLPGTRAQALLLHGFTGTPYEMRPLGDALAARGIGVHAPLLPGHGTVPAQLNHTRAEAWLAAAHRAFDELDPSVPRLIAGGSMGGLLSLLMATERPKEIAGLVLLAPALEYFASGWLALGLSQAGIAGALLDEIPKAAQGGDVEDEEARRRNPCYATMPTGGMRELSRLVRWTRAALPKVRAPVCTLHGARDRTIPPSASGLVARRVSSAWVERYLLPRSRHVLGIDVERDRVCSIACSFVDEVLGRSAA